MYKLCDGDVIRFSDGIRADKMRELANSELKKDGKLPPDYRMDQK